MPEWPIGGAEAGGEGGGMKEKLSPAAQAEKSEQSKGQKGSRLPTSP